MWVLWPSFLVAVAATGVFFSLFDPQEFWLLGEHLEISRLGAYTIDFFGFWCVGTGSSALTVFLAVTSHEEKTKRRPEENLVKTFVHQRFPVG